MKLPIFPNTSRYSAGTLWPRRSVSTVATLVERLTNVQQFVQQSWRVMPDVLTRRNGTWHFVWRVPAEFASFDARGIIRHSTKVRIGDDRNGRRASRIAEKFNADLEAYWRAAAGVPPAKRRRAMMLRGSTPGHSASSTSKTTASTSCQSKDCWSVLKRSSQTARRRCLRRAHSWTLRSGSRR